MLDKVKEIQNEVAGFNAQSIEKLALNEELRKILGNNSENMIETIY